MDGTIPTRYRLTETESAGYKQRTKRNVLDSDATLLLNMGALDGGSQKTLDIAKQAHRRHLCKFAPPPFG